MNQQNLGIFLDEAYAVIMKKIDSIELALKFTFTHLQLMEINLDELMTLQSALVQRKDVPLRRKKNRHIQP